MIFTFGLILYVKKKHRIGYIIFGYKNCGYDVCLNCYEKNIRKEDGDCCNVI